ncbi:radical SAM/SPASM domain-containing protein [Corynebacterium sp. H78]|uniref:radical SAM/SPASM domain-containing protein n=1 Tax=Corynebacterium sp. H78 TaxID=3133417 RepID=UPI0030AAC473
MDSDVATTPSSRAWMRKTRLHHKAIKLTFVPNQFCNLGCKYCYLGALTNNRDDSSDVVSQFQQIAAHLEHQGTLINSLLLHGAEISILPAPVLRELFAEYHAYRRHFRGELKALGRAGAPIHIKTNLYNFHVLRPLFEEFEVSISGSFDLPFSLHEELRVTKGGKSTLQRTLENVQLLGSYPHRKQISCVVGKEHLRRIDEFMDDLEWLDANGFDMATDFYIMFAYDSSNSEYISQLSQDQMVEFYERMLDRFAGTKFERAIYYEWFKEFTHDYCTNQINCGSNNFLVQKDGDVYPCHRGQAEPDLKFGNILNLGFPDMVRSGVDTIRDYEARNPSLSEDCRVCEYFYLCFAGCPIQRNNTADHKSYTCSLQKALYRAQPERFPPRPVESRQLVDAFIRENQPHIYDDLSVPRLMSPTPEVLDENNALNAIISRDPNLQELFRPGAIRLVVNGEARDLFSSHLFGRMTNVSLHDGDAVKVVVDKSYWDINTGGPGVGGLNALKVQLLRDNLVTYGDEQRTKMEHVATADVYSAQLLELEDCYVWDAAPFLTANRAALLPELGNLLSITTLKAREYHYSKHAKNAFYHLETINLPFHEFRFDVR